MLILIVLGGGSYIIYKQNAEKEKMIAIAHSEEVKVLYNKKIKHENKEALAKDIKDFKIRSYQIDNESLSMAIL